MVFHTLFHFMLMYNQQVCGTDFSSEKINSLQLWAFLYSKQRQVLPVGKESGAGIECFGRICK